MKAIRLKKPHTHAGRDYEPGTVLDLAAVKLHEESAQWLVTVGTAEWVEDAPKPAPKSIQTGG